MRLDCHDDNRREEKAIWSGLRASSSINTQIYNHIIFLPGHTDGWEHLARVILWNCERAILVHRLTTPTFSGWRNTRDATTAMKCFSIWTTRYYVEGKTLSSPITCEQRCRQTATNSLFKMLALRQLNLTNTSLPRTGLCPTFSLPMVV